MPSEESTRDEPISILLVEDDADHAELMIRTLRRQESPFEVTVVRDGPACLEAIERRPYSLVLLDYSLPRLSGLEVLVEIRKRSSAPVPVVMVTGQGDERVAVQAMGAGAADYVAKISGYLTTLPTVVRKVLKQHELALENRSLYLEVQRRLGETEGLLAVAQVLGSSLDSEQIAGRAAEEMNRLLGVDVSLVLKAEEDRAILRTLATRSVSELPAGVSPDIVLDGTGSDLTRQVAGADLLADRRVDHLALRSMPVRPTAFLYTPLLSKGHLLGAIVNYWWTRPARPVEEYVALATGVATQVALALDNARLYAQSRRSLAELEAAQEKLVEGATLRALGEMASGAAHHLNNLLAVILGRAQLLLRGTDSTVPRSSLEIIARTSTDAAEVVRRLQRFTRLDASEERQELDLNSLAREVIEMTRVRWQDEAQARGSQIEVVFQPGHVPRVSGNLPALREVLMNLVLNAVDALPQRGRIEIRTFPDGEHACLVVADNGIGMSEEVRRRALEPFFTTKGPKGTGLGLSVSYGVVKSHGGELRIQSRPRAGTVATIELPSIPARRDEQPSSASLGGRSPVLPGRVLVIDDEETVRSMLAEMVAAQGHEVLQAASGREGIALLSEGAKVDLVLTDLGMPEMTGWEVAQIVRSRWPWLAVGLVTGWGDQVNVPDVDRGLIIGTLAKPVPLAELESFVTAAIERVRTNELCAPEGGASRGSDTCRGAPLRPGIVR